MARLHFVLEKQLLTLNNQEIIASGDSNYDSSCRNDKSRKNVYRGIWY